MKIFTVSLLAWCVMTGQAFSQTLSNTGNTITLDHTCINNTFIGGTYTLNLAYIDPDNGYTTVPATSCTVSSNGMDNLVITVSGITLPTPSTNGYWSLPEADNGSISLTGGWSPGIIFWYHNPDGSLHFNCVPLPIYFSNFTSSLSGNTVHLSWQTQTEQNTTVIEIYRSSTGANFYKIGQVNAAGNSSGIINYSFNDNNPDADNYYKLKMLNSDGVPAITSIIIRRTCSSCHYTPPSPVYCPYTINGPDVICNLETPTAYSLSSAVPNYSTITWSVDNPSAAHVSTYPDFDRTQVTVLKKNMTAGVFLMAALSGCSNVITKYIAMGAPAPTIIADVECPNVVVWTNNAPGATSYAWTLMNITMATETFNEGGGPSWSPFIGDGSLYQITLSYTNACGTSPVATAGTFYCQPGTSTVAPPYTGPIVAPNPSNGVVTIGSGPAPVGGVSGPVKKTAAAGSKTVVDARAKTTVTDRSKAVPGAAVTAVAGPKVYQVRVLDVQGVLRKTFNYPGGVERVSVDLSGLVNGVYILQIYDNKTWTSRKVVLTR